MKLSQRRSHILKKEQGQILVLFLLILVVGLAIVLSIASRTVTDIRTTTTSDESNRAYFAAEAGAEEALRRLELGDAGNIDLTFTENNATANTELVTGLGDTFVYPFDIRKDDSAQIMMTTDTNGDNIIDLADLGSGTWASGKLNIYWGNAANGDNQAIEVSIIYLNPADPADEWKITKIAFDADSTRSASNNFCSATNNQQTVIDNSLGNNISRPTEYLEVIDIFNEDGNGLNNCSGRKGGALQAGDEVVLLRVRALYNSAPIFLAVEDESGDNLPRQGSLISSTGQTNSGVTRKLEVVRLWPALPSLFDYVLFNGGSNPLEK